MSAWKSKQAFFSSLKFFKERGAHGIIYGQTGSGKTTLQLEFAKWFFKRKECILWRDTVKANEISALGLIADLKVFTPEGCGVTLNNPLSDYELVPFSSYDDIFNELDPTRINVITERRFLRDPHLWTDFWAHFFFELIERSHKSQLTVPMSLFFDEINQICPTRDKALSKEQNRTSSIVALNLENLRSCRVRMVATSHGVKKLLKAVRDNFPYKFFKRTDEDVADESPALKKATNIIRSLSRDAYVILTPEKRYTNPVRGLVDWQLGKLAKRHQIEYWGDIPKRDWICFSEYRQDDGKKDRKGEALENLVKHIYEHGKWHTNFNKDGKKYTQKKLSSITGYSQKTISDIVNS